MRYRNPTVGVAVILIEDGRLWLGRRRDGGWCIPCGHVEWDETIEEAAYREAREETGLQIELIKLFAVHSNFHNPEQHTVGVWYLASGVDTSKARPGGDLIELHPFPLNEIPTLKFTTDQEVVNSLVELQNQSDSC